MVVPDWTQIVAPSSSSSVVASVERRFTIIALAVVEGGRARRGPTGVAADRPGRVADEDVDLAGLEGRTALVGVDGAELDGVGIAEDGGRDGAAEVGVEAGVLAALVEEAEARQAAIDAADELTALLDRGETAVAGRFGLLAGRGALGRGLAAAGVDAGSRFLGLRIAGWSLVTARGDDQGEDEQGDRGQAGSGHDASLNAW